MTKYTVETVIPPPPPPPPPPTLLGVGGGVSGRGVFLLFVFESCHLVVSTFPLFSNVCYFSPAVIRLSLWFPRRSMGICVVHTKLAGAGC